MTPQEQKSSNELAQERTDLALRRNLMAADRTLMAWIRTALSMISFGFTIYKVLQGFVQSGTLAMQAGTPRNAGLFLIGLGTVSVILGTIEYGQTLRELRRLERIPAWRTSLVIALIVSLAGLALFVSIVVRVL